MSEMACEPLLLGFLHHEDGIRPFELLRAERHLRVVDGAVGAEFLSQIKKLLEQPALMLL